MKRRPKASGSSRRSATSTSHASFSSVTRRSVRSTSTLSPGNTCRWSDDRVAGRKSGKPRAIRYRTSPNLVAYWRDGMRVLNYATKIEVRALPVVVQILSELDRWRTVNDVGKRLGLHAERAAVATLMDRLARASILQRSDRAPDPNELSMAQWESWNPAVGHFHAMTTG